MIRRFIREDSEVTYRGFEGRSVITPLESRFGFDVMVFINDTETTNFTKYLVEGKIKIVFHSPVVGKVYIKRLANPDKIHVFGHLQGEAFWEKFYDGLVQCLQDESIKRLDIEGKHIGFFAGGDFVSRVIANLVSNLSELLSRIKSMLVLGSMRVWRSLNSFDWLRNQYVEEETEDVSTSGDFGDWQGYVMETNYRSFVFNKLTGMSVFGKNLTPIKEINSNTIILYRYLYDPLERASIRGTIGTEASMAVAYFGPKKINYSVEHKKEQIVLTKTTENSILSNEQDSDDINTLNLTLGTFEVPLIIGFYNTVEGTYG